MTPRRRSARQSDSDHQLSLELSWLTEDELLGALRARGAGFLREVRFRPNRSRLISLSADRRRLNLHECFRAAPARVIDAVATFTMAPARSRAFRDSIEQMGEWHEGQVAEYVLGEPLASCGTERQLRYLESVYTSLNMSHFRGGLPDPLPIRLSDRMSRRFGHVSYARTSRGDRKVAELALNIDLLLPGNERALLDTLLHEMAHIEAWLVHGHREHGRLWREVARRVGCEAKACTHMRLRRRRSAAPVEDIPVLQLPSAPQPAIATKAASGLRRAAHQRA
ncbi:MAG TPA: SprT-like domain-containing protein [Longimicrobiales bacterium]|nr:SprT-like domain-containing protein [Longimicrobiales bacterium]